MDAFSSDSGPSQLPQEAVKAPGSGSTANVGSPRAALASIDLNPLQASVTKLHQPISNDDEDDTAASDSLEKTVKDLLTSQLGSGASDAVSVNEDLPEEPPTPTSSSLPFSASLPGDKPEIPSPSNSASSLRDSTSTLSRQASITSASSRMSSEVDSPTRSAYVFGSRRSLGGRSAADKALPTSSSVDAGPSAYPRLTRAPTRKRMSLGYVSSPSNGESSAAGLPPTPTSANSRSGFPRASVRPSPVGYRVPFPTSPASASVSPQAGGPSTPEASASSGVDHSQDGKTVMDMSRELLAEIASRERRVGELREELKKEEKELQSLRTQWQSCVARDMPATQQQQIKAEDGVAAANQNQIPVGVMDAVKGFSARLPSGLGSQLNALVDGLNTGSSPSKPTSNGSPLIGLGALNEEGEDILADQRSSTTSLSSTAAGGASSPESVRSSRSTASQQGPSLFGSLTALRESIEETLRIPDEQNGQAVAAGSSSTSSGSSKTENTGGWSQWSKRLKDVASRAEKALGDAMTVDGLAEAAKGQSTTVPSSSRSPHKDSVSLDDENEREKAALADLSWFGTLNNPPNQIMVTSPSLGFDPDHSPTKPRQLTPEQLLALSEADGLVPDPGARPMPRRSDSAMSNASSSSSSMRQQQRSSTTTTTTTGPTSKRQSSLPKGSFPVVANGASGDKKRQSTILGFMPWGSGAEKDMTSTATTTRETPTRRPSLQTTSSAQGKSALQSRLQNATTNAAGMKSPEIAGSNDSGDGSAEVGGAQHGGASEV